MVQGIMDKPKVKVIAEIKISVDTEAEKVQAIKDILLKAGLLVDIEGREITILERVLNGQYPQITKTTSYPD